MDGLYESNGFVSLLKVVYILIVFFIVLGISYYFSRFIGKRASGKNKFMKLIETLTLGNDRHLHIVKVSNKYYLISSSQKGICLVDKLEDEAFIEQINNVDIYGDFDSYLDSAYDNTNIFSDQNSIKNHIKKLNKLIKGNKRNEK